MDYWSGTIIHIASTSITNNLHRHYRHHIRAKSSLTQLLSRLSGAMAPAAPSPHVGDVATSTAASHINGSGPPEKFVNSTNMTGTTESFRSSDSNSNLFASVDGLDDGGQQNIYAAQVINSQVLPGFLPQNQFVPVPFVPSPYGHLIEPPRFCAKCGRDAVQDVIGAGEHQTRQQKNPFSQTERRNPFQHNPFQKGHEEKRRAPPNTPARGDVWKEGDEGYGIKIRKEDDQPDTQEIRCVIRFLPGV